MTDLARPLFNIRFDNSVLLYLRHYSLHVSCTQCSLEHFKYLREQFREGNTTILFVSYLLQKKKTSSQIQFSFLSLAFNIFLVNPSFSIRLDVFKRTLCISFLLRVNISLSNFELLYTYL